MMMQEQILSQPSLADILHILRQNGRSLAKQYDIASMGVFGSYVRGEARPDSDVDILVDFNSPPTLFPFVRLQNQMSDLLACSVDLVMKSALKPHIGANILAEVVGV
jgi:predicted nucleotidyltransferase